MDATVMALRQPLCSTSSSKESRILYGQRRPISEILSSRFCDQSHLQYYNSKFRCSSSVLSGNQEKTAKEKPLKKMKKKKQLKLLKGLTRDISTFSQIGFGLGSDSALLDQVKQNMISEAAEVLLEQLEKKRAEDKEHKRKMKEEKARLKAAGRMQNSVNCEMSSASSSSSESSDSECGEVIDMNKLKQTNTPQIGLLQGIKEATTTYPTPVIAVPVLPGNEQKISSQLSPSSNADTEKKIEVCMGGKCKKSGGGALLEEFQKAVGVEGVVVSGCKCMGKCREGPNVKVLNGGGVAADSGVRAPVCVGVGLEDVNMIVANLFGGNLNQLGFAPAT